MESGMASLRLEEEEESEWDVSESVEAISRDDDGLCLVGRFLTVSVINFQAMRNTLANLWHPLGGVQIKELGYGRYLFKFYADVDIERVLDGGPWTFNNHMLVVHRLQRGESPLEVPLQLANFWVQVHEVPPGMMSEEWAVKFGNFLGSFVQYDAKRSTSGEGDVMWVRAALDVSVPLKRRKRLGLAQGKSSYVEFKYERLPLFCFLCGRLGHGESFCQLRMVKGGGKDLPLQWDISLRAPRRGVVPAPSRWLREERDSSTIFGKNLLSNQDDRSKMWGASNVEGGKIDPMELGPLDEDSPLDPAEGKKRLRSEGVSSQISQQDNSTAGLALQARRSP